MEKKSSIFKGAISLTVAALIVKIIGVAYKIPMSYILGDEGMGYFNAAYTVYGVFYIITSAGVPKSIAIATADSEDGGISYKAYKSLINLFAIIGALITLLLISFANPLSSLVGSNKSYITLLAIAPSVFFVTVSGISRGFLQGKMKLVPIAISQVIEAVSKLILGILLALLGIHLRLPLPIISALSIIGITFGSVASMIYLLICSKASKKNDKIEQKHIEFRKLLKKILSVALPITLSSLLISLGGVFDLSIILHGLSALGYDESYTISLYGNYTTLSVPMVTLVSTLLLPITVSLLPKLVKKSKSLNEWFSIANSGFVITFILAIPCSLIFLLYSFDLLDILYGVYPSALAAESLSLLSLSALTLPLLNLMNTYLESIGCVTETLISLIIGIISKITLSLFFMNSSFGLYVLPLSTVFSYTVSLIISYLILKKKTGIKIPTLSLGIIIASLVSFSLPYLLIYNVGFFENGLLSMILSVSFSCLIYAISVALIIKAHYFSFYQHQNAQKTNNLII